MTRLEALAARLDAAHDGALDLSAEEYEATLNEWVGLLPAVVLPDAVAR